MDGDVVHTSHPEPVSKQVGTSNEATSVEKGDS